MNCLRNFNISSLNDFFFYWEDFKLKRILSRKKNKQITFSSYKHRLNREIERTFSQPFEPDGSLTTMIHRKLADKIDEFVYCLPSTGDILVFFGKIKMASESDLFSDFIISNTYKERSCLHNHNVKSLYNYSINLFE